MKYLFFSLSILSTVSHAVMAHWHRPGTRNEHGRTLGQSVVDGYMCYNLRLYLTAATNHTERVELKWARLRERGGSD